MRGLLCGTEMWNGINVLIDGMGNGTRADQYDTRGKRARGLSIEKEAARKTHVIKFSRSNLVH